MINFIVILSLENFSHNLLTFSDDYYSVSFDFSDIRDDIESIVGPSECSKNQIMNVVASRRQYFLLHFLNCGINDDTTSFSGNSSILSTVLLFI